MFTSPDADAPESFEIVIRDGVFSLSAMEYAVWALAHADPQRVGAEPTTRLTLVDAARRTGVERPRPFVDSLLSDGLLTEWDGTPESGVRFAKRHQVRPLALGLGNSKENLAAFEIGMPNAPRATVGYDIYHLWLFAHREPSMWDALQLIAAEASEANSQDSDVVLIDDPITLLNAFLGALPILLSTSCVYIDRLKTSSQSRAMSAAAQASADTGDKRRGQ